MNEPLYESVVQVYPAFSDQRGVIVNILSDPRIRHAAFITSAKGAVRSNHWHPNDDCGQWLYTIRGSFGAISVPVDEAGEWAGEPRELLVRSGDLLYTPPRVGHAYEFLEDTEWIHVSAVTREAENYKGGERPHTLALRVPLIGAR